MIPRLLKAEDYTEIADEIDLGYNHKAVYIRFMLEAFSGQRDRKYAAEWASRFKAGIHWGCADNRRKAILRRLYRVMQK